MLQQLISELGVSLKMASRVHHTLPKRIQNTHLVDAKKFGVVPFPDRMHQSQARLRERRGGIAAATCASAGRSEGHST